jgi:hypothetical protein
MNDLDIKIPQNITPPPRVSDYVLNPNFDENDKQSYKYGKIFKKSKENIYVYFNNGSTANYFPIKKLKKLGTTNKTSRNIFYLDENLDN